MYAKQKGFDRGLSNNLGRGSRYVGRTVQRNPMHTLRALMKAPLNIEKFKDLFWLSRASLHPLNMYARYINANAEQAGSYHTNSRHGAHNDLFNIEKRLPKVKGQMDNRYKPSFKGGYETVPSASVSSRFNSEAWESYNWSLGRDLFERDCRVLDPNITIEWVSDDPDKNSKTYGSPSDTRGTWKKWINYGNEPVGIEVKQVKGALEPSTKIVGGVLVAVNYEIERNGSNPADWVIRAWNGQMYPTGQPKSYVQGKWYKADKRMSLGKNPPADVKVAIGYQQNQMEYTYPIPSTLREWFRYKTSASHSKAKK